MGRNSCTEVELLNKDVGSNRQSAEGVQSMVHNSDSPALLNHGGFHKSDMQGQERGARLVTQGGLNKNDKMIKSDPTSRGYRLTLESFISRSVHRSREQQVQGHQHPHHGEHEAHVHGE
jgi:hypothetical protein